MGNHNDKRYGAGVLAVSLIIGLSIGFCAGYLTGTHGAESAGPGEMQMAESADPELKDQIPCSEQAAENTESTGNMESGGYEDVIGQFSVDTEPVITIGTTTIYLDEINARVYMARDQYVSLYGEEPWETELEDGVTVAEYAKQTMFEEMERVTILCDHAADYEDMALTDDERQSCASQAEDYMADLGVDVAGQFSVTKDAMMTIYEKDALSMKVYNRILEDLTESLREDDVYKNMEENEFETVLMDKFNEKYEAWKNDCKIETTETWEQLVIGAVG